MATSLNNLAEPYRQQGCYDEAEPLHKRALVIQQRALRPDHPQLFTTVYSYAAPLRLMDRKHEATDLIMRPRQSS